MASSSVTVAGARTSCSGAFAEPGGRGEHDRLEDVLRIGDVERLEHAADRRPRGRPRPRARRRAAIGADISTMPRLVLQSTALRVAAIAPRTRSPTRAPGRAIQSLRHLGAELEIADGHAVAVGEIVHVAGLRRAQLVEAGEPVGLGDVVRRQGSSERHLRCRDRLAARGRKRSASTSAMSIVATRLQARPGRHGVHLQHIGRAVRAAQDVDAAERRADRAAPRRQRARQARGRAASASGVPPCFTLVIQLGACRAIAATGSPVDDEDAEIAVVRARRRRRSAAGSRRRRPPPAAAGRPASRTSTRPRPCEPNSGFSTSGPAGAFALDDRAARRRALRPPSSAGRAARRGRAGTSSSTCRRSARSRPRSFQTGTPSAFKRVQDAEPPRDGLEASGRDGAHEHAVRQLAELAEAQPGRRRACRKRSPRAASQSTSTPRR